MFSIKDGIITITSALPYVNGVKHMGNIIGSLLPADIFHRFLDIMGVDNIFICGTDEHGTGVEIAAAAQWLSAKEYADKYYNIQTEIYRKWNFDFTFFGRTSSRTHKEITQDMFLSIYNNGFIKEQALTLPFCIKCDKFLPDRYVTGKCPHCGYAYAKGDQCESCGRVLDPADLKDLKCVMCGESKIEFRNEKHLFLDLSSLSNELEKWITSKKWPLSVKNFALGWLTEGLKPRCITRNLQWGIPVPLKEYENLVFYVWFDAPIGYISITKEAFENDKILDWEKYWTDAKIYHFIGKDNIPFHTIFWPGTLMASGKKYSLPHYIAGYEYLNWGGEKFSTSRGIGLFSDEVLDLFGVDYWRFYLSSILPETKDSNFDWDDFEARVNSELIGNYANLFSRITSFISTEYDGIVPKPGEMGSDENALISKLQKAVNEIENDIDNVRLREALKKIMSLSAETNKYFQDKKPWEAGDSHTTLYTSINVLHSITTLLNPFIPSTTEKAFRLLNIRKKAWKELADFMIAPSHKISREMLIKKIQDDDIEKAKTYVTKYAKADVTERAGTGLRLAVGQITSVKLHENADKLYVLEVDTGEKRQIVSALRGIYEKEQLEGKKIIVLTNLESRKFRGVESFGMLLACGDDAVLLTIDPSIRNGTLIEGFSAKSTIRYEDFKKHDIRIEANAALCDGKKLMSGNSDVHPEKPVPDGTKVN